MARLSRLRPPRRLEHGEEASLVEHLEELRQRLFFVIGAVVVGAIIGFSIHSHLIRWFLLTLPPRNRHPIANSPIQGFSTTLWLAAYFGFALALPIIVWQAWAFFMPALDKTRAQSLRWLGLLAGVLGFGGAAFAYFVVLPGALHFLTNYDSNQIRYSFLNVRDFIGFCVHVIIAMMIVFEMPVFLVGLTRLGVMTTDHLRKNRRMGFFLSGVLAMAVAPSVDPVTTTLSALPLFVLFEGSIQLCALLDRRANRRLARTTVAQT